MRKVTLTLVTLGILIVVIFSYPHYVEKPVEGGMGPLSIYIDPSLPAPEYHSPLDWWQTHHADVLERGDLSQSDCIQCHDPATSCDHCHQYVGASEIAP